MNVSNVSLRQLRAFVAIAEAGGFAAAARKLHLTPSALSLLIKELERGIEVRLFDRSTRSTVLSLAGSEFYPLARKLLEDLGRALESTQDLQRKKRGTLRIACTPLYAATTLPQLFLRYKQRYPAITVYVLDSLNQQALARVQSGEADLGIVPQRETPLELQQQSLLADRIWLICRPDHPLAARSRVTWAQALKEPMINLTLDFTKRLQADLFKHSDALVMNPAHEVSFITTALGLVQSGFGVTAQPGRALSLIGAFGLVARPLVAPVVDRQLSLFFPRGHELSPAAASFRDFLNEVDI
ncbi:MULTISPECIES: LysR family transcriptional regulator [unclassified Beijerinckia]|uniref:LysR family transcriptional regulator n=1 Tax=unclassified Beijerinckia TaxID=2638183 RepID=UPI000894900F|nr:MULTISPECIES: LysR family transcriptional regulator [unclassified Beijerinckia]MDH7798708.1 DNA-binding transcriptional LysR family regulator [Beijerinckia sp. GAS462]SED30286.1 DNA-binding transcriptional regulator, LysR family [Beijerinckia sp. 28-YEA-48]